MTTGLTAIPDGDADWTILYGGKTIGYIHFENLQYQARAPHRDGHKGGISPLVGTFETFELAQNCLLNLPRNL